MNIKLHKDMSEEEKIEVVKNNPRIIVAMLNMDIVLSEQIQILAVQGHWHTIIHFAMVGVDISENVKNAHYAKWNL